MDKTIKIFHLLLLLFPIAVCGAENQGIESANYEGRVVYYNSHYHDVDSLKTTANLPISKIFAANLSAEIDNGFGKNYKGGRGFDFTSAEFSTSVFIRDQSIGKIGVSFAYAKSHHDYPSNFFAPKDDVIKKYAVYGSYYVDFITLAASRNYYESVENNIENYTTSIGLDLYPSLNTAISLYSYSSLQDTDYNFAITHQPSLFNNNADLTFSYYNNSSNHDFDSYTLSFNYYFGNRVSLIDRDRKYR